MNKYLEKINFSSRFFLSKKLWLGILIIPIIILVNIHSISPTFSQESTQLQNKITIGAIRWDAWNGGRVTAQVEKTLSPQKYHFRLPWFAEILGDNRVRIRGGKQPIINQEIDYANQAGIDYWAFVIYNEYNYLSLSLNNYLKSHLKNKINFSMILTKQELEVSPSWWNHNLKRYIRLLKKPTYQTVLNGRPLIFIFYPNLETEKYLDRFKQLRAKILAEGFKNPYLVYMGFNPKIDYQKTKQLGFDALSAYAYNGNGTYQQMTQEIESKYWDASKNFNFPVIPLASTGWDKRPRIDNPVTWEKDAPYHRTRNYVETAKPKEIAQHIERALDWTEENQEYNPANTVIIYAWNEYDEGGWIAPTRGEDGKPNQERLDAIKEMLEQRSK